MQRLILVTLWILLSTFAVAQICEDGRCMNVNPTLASCQTASGCTRTMRIFPQNGMQDACRVHTPVVWYCCGEIQYDTTDDVAGARLSRITMARALVNARERKREKARSPIALIH